MKREPSFASLVATSLANQWTTVQTVAVRKLTFITFLWGVIVLLASLAATIVDQQAAFAPYGRLAAILFFGLLTASWIAIAIHQVTQDLHDEQGARHQWAATLATLPTIIIAALLVWSTVSLTFLGLAEPVQPLVTDYASCLTNGGLVIQTNPAQCITATNTFTDPRGVQ